VRGLLEATESSYNAPIMRKILLTGGGSGGHIFPLIAVVREIKKLAQEKNIKVRLRYLGPPDAYTNYLSKEGIEVRDILSAKLRRYCSLKNLIDIPKFLIALFQSFLKVASFKPDIVFSKGGTGALPVVLACRCYQIPIIIHESDSIPGLTNKICGKFAGKIFLAFTSAKKFFPENISQVVGNPVRQELLKAIDSNPADLKKKLGLTPLKPVIVILGGSQGAARINDFVIDNLDELLTIGQIVHQVGPANYDQIKKYQRAGYQVFDFLRDNYGEVLMAGDLIISRAGAGAIFDIAALGKPSILIPLPEAAGSHQLVNAQEYAGTGAAVMIEELNLNLKSFLREVDNLLSDPRLLSNSQSAARAFSKSNPAQKIAAALLINNQ